MCYAFPNLSLCLGSLPMDIVWIHNEDELDPDDTDYVQTSDGHTHRLLISAAFPEDSGTYICEAYNDFGETDTACELIVIGVWESSFLSFISSPVFLLNVMRQCITTQWFHTAQQNNNGKVNSLYPKL